MGWWRQRSRREQILLVGLAVIAAALFVWFALVTPLVQAGRAAEARHARAAQAQVAVMGVLGKMAALKATPRPASAARPLDAVVRETAAASGIVLARVEAEPEGGLRVAAPSADATVLFPWLALLQREHGIVVSHLAVVKNETGALALDATLTRPGA